MVKIYGTFNADFPEYGIKKGDTGQIVYKNYDKNYYLIQLLITQDIIRVPVSDFSPEYDSSC